MAIENNRLKELIREFGSIRSELRKSIVEGGNDEEIALIDNTVSSLFDRICAYPVRTENEGNEIRLFAITMIKEICERDGLVTNCLELLDRNNIDKIRMLPDR